MYKGRLRFNNQHIFFNPNPYLEPLLNEMFERLEKEKKKVKKWNWFMIAQKMLEK